MMKTPKRCKQDKHKEIDSDVNIALDILLCKLDRIEEKIDRLRENEIEPEQIKAVTGVTYDG